MGFSRSIDTYDKDICAFWNSDDHPIPSGANLVSIYRNIELALRKIGFHGFLYVLAYGDKLNHTESDLKKAGFEVMPPVKDPETSTDWEMSLGILSKAAPRFPAVLVAIAKQNQESECLNVLRRLKARNYPVLVIDPPPPVETGDSLFPSRDSVLACTRYVDEERKPHAFESDSDSEEDTAESLLKNPKRLAKYGLSLFS